MKDKFLEFAKTPLGTAICIGVFVLVITIYLFTNTSIGRKALKGFRSEFSRFKEDAKKSKDELDEEIKKHKEETKKEVEEKTSHTDGKLDIALNYFVKITETINNKKVKELGVEMLKDLAEYESEKLTDEKTN